MTSRKPGSKIFTRSKTCPILGYPSLTSLQFWNGDSINMDGKQLPTKMEVLKHFAALRRNSTVKNQSLNEDAWETLNVVSNYWRFANIPIQELSNTKSKLYRAADKLLKLWDQYQKITKNLKYRAKKTKGDILLYEKFKKDLSLLFDISHPNVESLITKDTLRSKEEKDIDIAFLHDQMGERKLVMGKADRQYTVKYERRENLLLKKKQRSQKWKKQKNELTSLKIVETIHEPSTMKHEKDPDFAPPLSKKKKSNDYIPVLLPRKILEGPHVCQMGDRTGESYRNHTGSVASVLQDARSPDGAPLDLNQFVLSKSSDKRKREDARENFTQEFYDKFVPPDNAAIHWDEKFCKNVLGKDEGDKMIAILVSGEGLEEGFLIDMFSLENGEGITVANYCGSAIERCRLCPNCKVMVFDTPSVNSGIHKGAATIIQRDILGYKLIWAACRKHVAELIVKAVYEKLFGKSKSPYFKELKHFQDCWMKKPTESDDVILEKDLAGVKFKFTTDTEIQKAQEVAKELTTLRYDRKKLPRDDYRELLDLALMLNPYALNNADDYIQPTLKKPGAHNTSRWMCTCIYCMKMFYFQDQRVLEYSENFKANLQRFVKWLLLVYIPYWFKVPLSSDAAYYDLELYRSLQLYKDTDAEISCVALTVQSRHLWYLAPECFILFCLFGTKLSEDEKSGIAANLLTHTVPQTWDLLKVKFPKLSNTTSLKSLITEMSWFPFHLLDISTEWLQQPPSEWETNASYLKMQKFARTLKTTNDTAERGVKLISDYSNILTKDSEERKKIVMTVQNHRKNFPVMKKEVLN